MYVGISDLVPGTDTPQSSPFCTPIGSNNEEPSKQIPNRIRKVIYTNKDDTSGFEIRTKYVPQNPKPKEDPPPYLHHL